MGQQMKAASDLVHILFRVAGQLGRTLFNRAKQGLVSENCRMRQDNPAVRFPPCDLSTTALNHCDYRLYLDSGLAHAQFVVETIRSHTAARNLAVCEWGCGPGRVIQHLPQLDDGIARLVGTDRHHATIDWCRQNLPHLEFLSHGMHPPLTLANNSMDVVYCCAVFSHLAEPLHHAWVTEILRLLRPGGLLIASFHGNHYEDRMAANELDDYRNGGLVVHPKGNEGETDFVSFAGDRFVREHLLNLFDNITRLDDAPFLQTVWAATAPAA